MNQKVLIIISIIGVIAIAGAIINFNSTENNVNQNEDSKFGETDVNQNEDSKFGETDVINSKMQAIIDLRYTNEQSENPYYPKEREWISSGPFKLDRSEYVLGEKLFVNISNWL